MGWTERFSEVLELTVDTLLTSLSKLGSMACLLGGAMISFYSLSELMHLGYFVKVDVKGNVDYEIDVPEFDIILKNKTPFQRRVLEHKNGRFYQLKDLVAPSNMVIAISILITLGTALEFFCKFLKKWLQHKREKHLSRPSLSEYLSNGLASFCSSLSTASFIAVFVKGGLYFLIGHLTKDALTYPQTGNKTVDNECYKGPTDITSFPFDFTEDQYFNLSEILTRGKVNLTSQIEVNYGAGASLNANHLIPAFIVTSALLGVSSSLGLSFFRKKEAQKREERLLLGKSPQCRIFSETPPLNNLSLSTQEDSLHSLI